MLLTTEPDAAREECQKKRKKEKEGKKEKKALHVPPSGRHRPQMKLYETIPIDNKANFYGSDKYVIMFSGAFQILSQSINHTGNFLSPPPPSATPATTHPPLYHPPCLTYLRGSI